MHIAICYCVFYTLLIFPMSSYRFSMYKYAFTRLICSSEVEESIYFQFDAEFRRFSVDREKQGLFGEFEKLLSELHSIQNGEFVVTYTDQQGDLLPINNDDNYHKALTTAKPLLRVMVQRKGMLMSFSVILRYSLSFIKFTCKSIWQIKPIGIELEHTYLRYMSVTCLHRLHAFRYVATVTLNFVQCTTYKI